MLVITWYWFEPSLSSGASSSCNFPRHNFPSIYKLIFYCWTVVTLICLSAPTFLLFQMRNVAANFKVLDIGSDNYGQVCVFYIVLTLYHNQPQIVALKAQYQNTQNTQKRPQITPKMSLNHHQNVPTPSKNVLKSPPDHPRTSPEHPSTSQNHLDCPKTSLNHPKQISQDPLRTSQITPERTLIAPEYLRRSLQNVLNSP